MKHACSHVEQHNDALGVLLTRGQGIPCYTHLRMTAARGVRVLARGVRGARVRLRSAALLDQVVKALGHLGRDDDVALLDVRQEARAVNGVPEA